MTCSLHILDVMASYYCWMLCDLVGGLHTIRNECNASTSFLTLRCTLFVLRNVGCHNLGHHHPCARLWKAQIVFVIAYNKKQSLVCVRLYCVL